MRAEDVAPYKFLYSSPKLHNHPIYLFWEKQNKNTTADGLKPL